MSDGQLRAVIRGLADRHIALGLETNVLQATSTCKPGAGKAAPITAEVERLKRLGADLRYLAMNEPLMGGHGVTGPGDCHASIGAVAEDVAATLKPLLAIYPDLQIGDVEPVGRVDPARHLADMQDWPGQIGAWMAAYRAAMGRPLAFMHADTVWERDWRGDLQQLAQVSRTAGVPFGVLYRGDLSEMSDAALAANTARYAGQVEDGLGLRPDHAVFQTWWNWPRHDLPDTDLTTMTGMVRDYLRSRTTVTLAGGRLRLTGAQGDPVGQAALTVEVHDPAPGATLTPQRIAGQVPPGATAALFALRVHADCLCAPTPARIELVGFQYGEQGAQGGYDQSRFAWDLHAWFSAMPGATRAMLAGGATALQVNAAAGQKLVMNGPRFPGAGRRNVRGAVYLAGEPHVRGCRVCGADLLRRGRRRDQAHAAPLCAELAAGGRADDGCGRVCGAARGCGAGPDGVGRVWRGRRAPPDPDGPALSRAWFSGG